MFRWVFWVGFLLPNLRPGRAHDVHPQGGAHRARRLPSHPALRQLSRRHGEQVPVAAALYSARPGRRLCLPQPRVEVQFGADPVPVAVRALQAVEPARGLQAGGEAQGRVADPH